MQATGPTNQPERGPNGEMGLEYVVGNAGETGSAPSILIFIFPFFLLPSCKLFLDQNLIYNVFYLKEYKNPYIIV